MTDSQGADFPQLHIQGLRCFKDRQRVPIDAGITALIGLNNGGKSSLLRLPWELRPLFGRLAADGLMQFNDGARREGTQSLGGERVLSHLVGARPRVIFEMGPCPAGSDEESWPTAVHFDIEDTQSRLAEIEVAGERIDVPEVGTSTVQARVRDEQFNALQMGGRPIDHRALMAFAGDLHRVMYVGPFRNVINVGGQTNYYDVAVGEQFVQKFHDLKAGQVPSQNEAVARLQREIEMIFGFGRVEFNAAPDMKAMQATIDGRSYRLSELGAGLTHFVLILVNALVAAPSWLLIDEPELNLHATLQLELLLTASSYASGGVLFTTHSLGLARSTAERILVVSRDADGAGRVEEYNDHARLAQLAGELSFAGTPALGFERILLVEGKTDVKTFQQLLAMFGSSQTVLVLSLGGDDHINGDSQVELAELLRIGAPIAAVVDSERSEADGVLSKVRSDFVALCGELGITCHVLDRRAIENYFTPEVMEGFIGKPTAPLGPFDAVPPGWKKRNNWRAARAMSKDDLAETDLGAWLQEYAS